ncbi:MAG: aminotransferase class V-fold PLP-dependent enzyme, partial [Balneolaceae bacterium]|nr:aminotransferase class V-fold PLP-dependent enzyme [Balneolaceae bacterium]
MDCQKHLFSIPEDHHYLNCAYFSPMLKSVEEAGIAGIRQKRAPWKVGPDEFFASSNRLRELYAELIHAENPRRVAILPAASYGLSTVARNLPEAKGKNIVIAGEQFPSNVYPWMRYCRENGSELRIVSPATEQEHRGNTWNRRLLEAIDRDTLLVALGNVHWTDGTIFDLSRIGDRAREVDAWFV